jgi:cytochrome c-type biogenesis protein CcmH/NrfF
MKSKINALMLVALVLTLLVTACSSGATTTTAPATTSSDGAKLLQERCTVCHTLSRTESQRLSAADWKLVVDAMIARGAKLTTDEETLVVDYLATNFGN